MGLNVIVRTAKESWRRAVLTTLLFLLIPLGCNLIFVMAGENIHGLMLYGQVLQVLLFVWLLEKQEFHRAMWLKVLSLATAGILIMTGGLYIRLANQCYFKAMFKQQEMISYLTTMVTKIKTSEDYRADRPVLFVNEKHIKDPTITVMEEMESIHTLAYQFNTFESLNAGTWRIYMERWCGFTPAYYWRTDMLSLPEVKAMPHYPDEGSIKVINDVLVIKF